MTTVVTAQFPQMVAALPGNIVNPFQPFKEHMQNAGVWVGARYRFNK